MDNILVINQGTYGTRAIVFNLHGERLASVFEPLDIIAKGQFVEQDPDEWWTKTKSVVIECLRNDDIRRNIKLVTVTSPGSSLVYLDRVGNPLGKAIMHLDTRSVEQANRLKSLPEFRDVEQRTGMVSTYGCDIPKLMWLKENESNRFNRIHKFMSPTGYIMFKLTSGFISDEHNAARAHVDLKTGNLPNDLLNILGISPDIYPTFVRPCQEGPSLRPDVINEFALPSDVKLVVASYDNACAFVGSGVTKVGEAYDNSGTTTSFRVISDTHIKHPEDSIYSMPHPTERNLWLVGGSMNLCGPVIGWFKWNFMPKDQQEQINEYANKSPVGSKGLIFLPYLIGEREPIHDPHIRGAFLGLTLDHNVHDLARSVFEGLSFGVRDIMRVIADSGINVSDVRVGGGVANNDTLSKIKADVLGKRILVLREKESAALGAAMMAAVGAGYYGSISDASVSMITVDKVIEPDQAAHNKYREIFLRYKAFYQSLKPMFQGRLVIETK